LSSLSGHYNYQCKTIIVAELLKGLELEVTEINNTIFAEINTFKFLHQEQTEANGFSD